MSCLALVVTVLEVPDENGEVIRYVTATEAPGYFSLMLGVTTAMVNKWHQRRKVTGYRIGAGVYFRLDELKEIEFVTRNTPQGRPRRKT